MSIRQLLEEPLDNFRNQLNAGENAKDGNADRKNDCQIGGDCVGNGLEHVSGNGNGGGSYFGQKCGKKIHRIPLSAQLGILIYDTAELP